MVSRFIVRDENISSDHSFRLNRGQAMLRGRNAAKKDAKRLRERRERLSSKN
ncbi:hypothetical protein [Methanobrevibacter sp.]|uniref:hypothetical protein n=1 Tax=Methanobrevibacter sp. TaxID=66852 RepID=UPI003866394C